MGKLREREGGGASGRIPGSCGPTCHFYGDKRGGQSQSLAQGLDISPWGEKNHLPGVSDTGSVSIQLCQPLQEPEWLWLKRESSSFSLQAWGWCGGPTVSVARFLLPCCYFMPGTTSLSVWLKIVYYCIYTYAKWGDINGELQAEPVVSRA